MNDARWPKDGHLVVLGQTGLGKTVLVRSLIQNGRRHWARILIADPQAEYGQVAVAVGSIEEWADYVAAAGDSWCVTYQADDLDEAMPALCEAVYNIAGAGRPPLLFVAEEADYWCSPSAILPEFAHLLKYGRKLGAWVCGVARRPSEVHRLLTSQARHVYAFGTVEPVDVDYLRRAVSVEFAAAVQGLEPLQACWWDRRERTVTRVEVDPQTLTLRILPATAPAGVDKEEPPAVG